MSYVWMCLVVLFVQIFLLDNINIGASVAIWMRPMIFPLVVLLLPIELKMIWVLIISYVVGFTMDISVGGEGLYAATLLPLALIRPTLVYITTSRSIEAGDQTQLLTKLSLRQLMLYIASGLLIHHALFFMLEALSFNDVGRLLLTILLSTLLSLAIGWFVVRIFISKVLLR